MATILDRKYTDKDSTPQILAAISKLAGDMSSRVVLVDEIDWHREKFCEILRLTKILQRRWSASH